MAMKIVVALLVMALLASTGCFNDVDDEDAQQRHDVGVELARALDSQTWGFPDDCELPTSYWETMEGLEEQVRLWEIVMGYSPSDDHIAAAISARSEYVQHVVAIHYKCKSDEGGG